MAEGAEIGLLSGLSSVREAATDLASVATAVFDGVTLDTSISSSLNLDDFSGELDMDTERHR